MSFFRRLLDRLKAASDEVSFCLWLAEESCLCLGTLPKIRETAQLRRLKNVKHFPVSEGDTPHGSLLIFPLMQKKAKYRRSLRGEILFHYSLASICLVLQVFATRALPFHSSLPRRTSRCTPAIPVKWYQRRPLPRHNLYRVAAFQRFEIRRTYQTACILGFLRVADTLLNHNGAETTC